MFQGFHNPIDRYHNTTKYNSLYEGVQYRSIVFNAFYVVITHVTLLLNSLQQVSIIAIRTRFQLSDGSKD